jgi:hypothetical protein
MNQSFEVLETFEISGRGLVVVLPGDIASLPHASRLSVIVHVAGQPSIHTSASFPLLTLGAGQLIAKKDAHMSGITFQRPNPAFKWPGVNNRAARPTLHWDASCCMRLYKPCI